MRPLTDFPDPVTGLMPDGYVWEPELGRTVRVVAAREPTHIFPTLKVDHVLVKGAWLDVLQFNPTQCHQRAVRVVPQEYLEFHEDRVAFLEKQQPIYLACILDRHIQQWGLESSASNTEASVNPWVRVNAKSLQIGTGQVTLRYEIPSLPILVCRISEYLRIVNGS